jgi:hypothetical protein
MHESLKNLFLNELNEGIRFYQIKKFKKSFSHFERAHVLGQCFVVPHATAHIWMLKIGIKVRDGREVLSQLIRIPLGIISSAIGMIPTGNTGGSNVGLTKKMKIPTDLLNIIEHPEKKDIS